MGKGVLEALLTGVTHIKKIFAFAETFLWVGESKGYKKTEKEVKNE